MKRKKKFRKFNIVDVIESFDEMIRSNNMILFDINTVYQKTQILGFVVLWAMPMK